jgi:hypothetical protein
LVKKLRAWLLLLALSIYTFPFHRLSAKNVLDEQIQVVLPLRRVVRVAVNMPDVGNVVLLQVSMHALADADQAIPLPASEPQQLGGPLVLVDSTSR